METLLDFISLTKEYSYIVAVVLMVAFIPFWTFLTERDKQSKLPDKGH